MSKNYDYILGQNSYDCGIASIMTILRYYGIKTSRDEIMLKLRKKDNGYTAYDLIKIAKMYGINGYGIKSKIEDINKMPVIAHTIKDKNMFHFIVVLERSNKKKTLKIMDPSEGIKVISYDEFNRVTTNIFLLFEGRKKKSISDQRFKKEILKVFMNNKSAILKALLFSVFCVVLSLIFNYYLKVMLSNSNNHSFLIIIFLIYLQVVFWKNVITYFKDNSTLKISNKIDRDITNNVIAHIFKLPYEYFISKSTGELVTIVEDVEIFKQVVTRVFILSLVDFILIIVILLYLLFLNVKVALLLIILIFFLLIITKKHQYIFNNNYVSLKRSKISYTSFLINYLSAFETIKNLNISDKIIQSLSKKYFKVLDSDENYNKNYYRYNMVLSLLTDFFYLLIILVSLYITSVNSNIFDVVLFSSIFYLVIGLLSNINECIVMYKVYQSSTDRVLDCLEIKPEEFEKTNFNRVNSIKFVDISYSVNDSVILKDVTLNIYKGEKIYITGSSGIGKSTLIKLLLNYFTPTKGNILIDDLNAKDMDLSFIRERTTYVGQNECLFSGSILDNLKLISNSMDDIIKVSKITLLDKFLVKNNIDYNYLLEENGNNLSGGERKKIILTRGLLRFNDVLILDEVFNEISIDEEREILKNIFNEYNAGIVVVISHRNTNTDLFDKKYKIEGDGKLYEIK